MTKAEATQAAQGMADKTREPYVVVKRIRGGYQALHADTAAINGCKVISKAVPATVPIDPNMFLALEFGYKGGEKGWNWEMTRAEFERVIIQKGKR